MDWSILAAGADVLSASLDALRMVILQYFLARDHALSLVDWCLLAELLLHAMDCDP